MDSKQYLANLQVPAGRVDAVLDTDTYNEIDDQFALSYMFLSPEKFNLKAIYAAPFFNSHSTSPKDGMERSYDEIMKLLGLLGRNEYVENVYKGSVDYLIDDADHLSNIPIEVKSGKDYIVHSALNKFLSNDDYNIKQAYVLSNEQRVYTDKGITYIPIYYVMFFHNVSNVVEGFKIGRTIGFKTANINVTSSCYLLKHGVYFAKIYIEEIYNEAYPLLIEKEQYILQERRDKHG